MIEAPLGVVDGMAAIDSGAKPRMRLSMSSARRGKALRRGDPWRRGARGAGDGATLGVVLSSGGLDRCLSIFG